MSLHLQCQLDSSPDPQMLKLLGVRHLNIIEYLGLSYQIAGLRHNKKVEHC